MKRFLRNTLLVLLTLLTVRTPAYATGLTQDELINGGKTGYEVAEGCYSGSSQPVTQTGSPKLSEAAINAINALKPVYEQAAQQTNIRWEIFAALDYREDNNRPNASMLGGEPLGQPSVDHPDLAPKTKLESVIMGSKILKGLAKGVYDVDVTKPMTDEQVKSAFLTYNRGYSYKNANQPVDTSPYVMNNFDEAHNHMIFPNIPGETLAGRSDGERLGAYTVYVALGGSSAPNGGCTGTVVSGDLQQLALLYAWPTYHEANWFEFYKPAGYATSPYKDAVDLAKRTGDSYVGGGIHPGIDCGGFVTQLMRNSKTDPDYNKNQGPVTEQQNYIEKSGKYVTVSNKAPRQPGDIYIAPGAVHTYIYIGKLKGWQYDSASASFDREGNDDWRTPMSSRTYFESGATWYRKVK